MTDLTKAGFANLTPEQQEILAKDVVDRSKRRQELLELAAAERGSIFPAIALPIAIFALFLYTQPQLIELLARRLLHPIPAVMRDVFASYIERLPLCVAILGSYFSVQNQINAARRRTDAIFKLVIEEGHQKPNARPGIDPVQSP